MRRHPLADVVKALGMTLNIIGETVVVFGIECFNKGVSITLLLIYLDFPLVLSSVIDAVSLVYLEIFSIVTADTTFSCPIQVIFPSVDIEYTSFN